MSNEPQWPAGTLRDATSDQLDVGSDDDEAETVPASHISAAVMDRASVVCVSSADMDSLMSCESVVHEQDERWPLYSVAGHHDRWALEVFSPPRVGPVLERDYLANSVSVDLQTGWDSHAWEDRAALWRWIARRQPDVAMLSPPCTMYSNLQIMNRKHVSVEEWTARMDAARQHLEFAVAVATEQARHGRGFVLEHPKLASSWREPCIVTLALQHGTLVEFDQCRYELRSPAGLLLKKPTRLLTNMPSIVNEFTGKQCTCAVDHGSITGQERGQQVSRLAQIYPPLLVGALARCCAVHMSIYP